MDVGLQTMEKSMKCKKPRKWMICVPERWFRTHLYWRLDKYPQLALYRGGRGRAAARGVVAEVISWFNGS